MSKEDLLTAFPFGDKILKRIEFSKETSIQASGNSHTNAIKKQHNNSSEKSTEDELPFSKVIGNIIKIDDRRYRTIVRTNAISIEDMDKEDQDTIISKYAEYINGLIRPHQIYIPSFILDIRERIQHLEERYEVENDKIREWIQDEIDHQKSLLEENNVLDTQFYIIFQTEFKPSGDTVSDYLKAKKLLYRQVNFATTELEGIGMRIHQLSYDEIGKLYYYFFNPFSAGVQEPTFDNNQISGLVIDNQKLNIKSKNTIENNLDEDESKFSFEGDVTNYLEQGGIDFKMKIAPYSINDVESANYIRIGATYMTVYEIYDYPTHLPRLWSKKLYHFRDNIDISMHINPIPTAEIVKELDKAAIDLGSSLIDEKTGEKMKATTYIEKKMDSGSASVSKVMDELDTGDESLFHFSYYVLVKERSLDKLEDTCIELESTLGSMRVLFRRCSDNMKNALTSVCPVGLNLLNTTRNMLTKGVANSFPFTNFSYTHKNGYFLATHRYNQSFVYFNPFNLENANGAIVGTSGGGKSTAMKKITKGGIIYDDLRINAIDPEGENIRFAESIGAQVIDIYAGSQHKINVLDVEIDDEMNSLIKPTINFVKIFLDTIFGDYDKRKYSSIIDFSLNYLYKQFGFTDDKETYYTEADNNNEEVFKLGKTKRKPPELYDLYKIWLNNELLDKVGDTKELANMLREWTREGTNDLYDGQTNVDFNNKRIYYNLKHMDKKIKEPSIFVLFQRLWDSSRKNPLEHKFIIIFEAHVLFRKDVIGEYVYDINKRIRKYGGGSLYDTQNITDFMKTKWGPEIIKNCSWAILVKQDKDDVDILQNRYQMTRSEALKMTMFNRDRGEAYLIADNYRIPINVRLSKKEKYAFTTKTEDLVEIAKMEGKL